MDKSLRNSLRLAITNCRKLLEDEYARQLEGKFGVHANGKIETFEKLPLLGQKGKVERQVIEATLLHEETSGITLPEAIERYIRESAFTTLNRFFALKLMEHPNRKLIQESISKGNQSKGFQQFAMVSPAAFQGEADGGYRFYLKLLIDDLSNGVGVLFDNEQLQSILFPSSTCLLPILEILNDPELESIWGEDETIGWMYQFFTPPELRDQARKASAAPRNSYELSFRNQFYTPRYVVEFLADNTLGRIWYEMRQGNTTLIDQCGYLIHPLDQSIPHREKHDPRTLRILDPAGGSGHFLIYCFDLLENIYREAYEDENLGPTLQRDYPDQATFINDVPRLIVEQNLFGIDIDLRATQIASLAIWLRAQRAFSEQKIPIRKRPIITKTNIVCAEPMPGNFSMLGEFLRNLKPRILGNLVRQVWEQMELAGEAGSLLKVEQTLRGAIRETHQAWQRMPEPQQLSLFGEQSKPVQIALELLEIKDEAFWDEVEARVLDSLRTYTLRASGMEKVSRRLFAHDAEQGFAFLDLLQEPFDVILMNPPFGAASINSKDYIKKNYPRTKNDLYAAFVERGLELLCPGGLLGAITSRTGFFLKSFQKWREEILLQESQFISMADLGYGVLDTAMVETAAYVIEKKEVEL